ncbi:MAG: hypothetical protein ACFB9M_04660 [Myxococcota bacterium]
MTPQVKTIQGPTSGFGSGLVSGSSDRDDRDRLWFHGFCLLWASAVIFHQVSLKHVANTPVQLALTLTAASLFVARPTLNRLLVLACLQITEVMIYAPYLSNHWMLATTANFILVGSALIEIPSGSFNRERIFARFAASARLLVPVLYFWAVFHKLNAGFFNPDASCAGDLVAALGLPIPDAITGHLWVRWAAIWMTIFVEALIPVLLLWSRTRTMGVLVGAFFHFIIGLSEYKPYYNFSSVLLALYFLYLSPDDVSRSWQGLVRRPLAWLQENPFGRFIFFGAALSLAYVLAYLGVFGEYSRYYRLASVGLWVCYGLAFIVFVGFGVWQERERFQVRTPTAWHLLRVPRRQLAIPALFFLNGTLPYLGGKTELALSMFSNLVTEEGRTNHYVVQEPLYLWPYQSKVVRIVESSEPELERLRDSERGMVWFEFRDFMHRHPDASVTYQLGGETFEVLRAGDDPAFVQPTPLWQRKLFLFRHPDLSPVSRCDH